MRISSALLVLALGFTEGCAAALTTLTAAAAASAEGAARTAPAREMLLFGGDGHKTFLGCLSCNQYASGSVHNRYSDFGSRYSQTSIFNRYADFGSRYSQFSACNPNAADPPVIVGRDGAFFGKLTLNKYAPGAIKGASLVAWLVGVCAD